MNSKNSGMGGGEGGDVVVETVVRIMVPFIQLFGLYVIIHGAGGPGGGFQGGVIIASSFILYVIAVGIVKAGNRFSEAKNTMFFSTGLYIYAGVGLLCLICGLAFATHAQFLNYGYIPLTHHFEENRALGMDIVEIGIGITVMAVITSIFFNLVWKKEGEEVEGED